MQKYVLFGVVTAAMVLADQLTKLWVVRNIRYRAEEIEVIPHLFSLVHAQNRGAAFGIMQGQMAVFAVFTVVAMGVLGHMLWQLDREDRFQTTALGMIASGAIGNAIDRARQGHVTDFLRVYTDNPDVISLLTRLRLPAEWPSFNVADAAIVVGLLMFLVHFLFLERDQDVEPAPPDRPLKDPS